MLAHSTRDTLGALYDKGPCPPSSRPPGLRDTSYRLHSVSFHTRQSINKDAATRKPHHLTAASALLNAGLSWVALRWVVLCCAVPCCSVLFCAVLCCALPLLSRGWLDWLGRGGAGGRAVVCMYLYISTGT